MTNDGQVTLQAVRVSDAAMASEEKQMQLVTDTALKIARLCPLQHHALV